MRGISGMPSDELAGDAKQRVPLPSTSKFQKRIMTYEEMAARAKEQRTEPKVQQFAKDKITFSQEGLKSAREMRVYLNENGLNQSRDILAEFEELDKQLHTRLMDYTNNFLGEMQEVIDEERKRWGNEAAGHSFDHSVSLTAKAYQVVHDRIVDEFSREDRDTTYVIDEVTKPELSIGSYWEQVLAKIW